MRKFIYSICLMLSTLCANAQVMVESEISSMEMLIGEHVAITVTVQAPDTSHVLFPTQALMPQGIEVLEALQAPVEELSDGVGLFVCQLVLTSFEEGLYYLPPLDVQVDGKSYPTKQLALKVMLPEDVDTTYVEAYDGPRYNGPKDIQAQPFDWILDGWYIPLCMFFVLAVMILGTVYLFMRLRKNKPILRQMHVVKRILPHQRALETIEDIKSARMTVADDSKEYYTRLTDALRIYINERYGFNAMEMTSAEIIDRLISVGDPKALDELRHLFQTADLVKFAKYSTQISENDANLVSAIEFINQTKQVNQPTQIREVARLTENERRSIRSRRLLKSFVIALGTLSIILFIAIVIIIIQLL